MLQFSLTGEKNRYTSETFWQTAF